MNLRNKTAAVITYRGVAYGPGRSIPVSDEDTGKKDIALMLADGRLEAEIGEKAKGNPSDGLTVDQLKAALEEKGIAYEAGAKKAELANLLDASAA